MRQYTFHQLVDVEKLQELMDRFYAATGIPVGIIDIEGHIHVATGWRGEELIELYKSAIDRGCKPNAAVMDLTIPGGMGGVQDHGN